MVSKNQQISKISYKNSQSEESTIFNNILWGLGEALKNRNKNINIKNNAEDLPEILKDTSGSNRSWFGGTYTDVKNIYGLAINGRIIKDYDKDQYLVSRFLN